MPLTAVMEGPIPHEGVHTLLGDLENLGTTGVLCFRSAEAVGQVELVGGQIDTRQFEDERARDSVEILLSL